MNITIPKYCGDLSDMNRDQVCKRVAGIYGAHLMQDKIDADTDRLHYANRPYVRQQLAAHIAHNKAMLVQMVDRLPVCTH